MAKTGSRIYRKKENEPTLARLGQPRIQAFFTPFSSLFAAQGGNFFPFPQPILPPVQAPGPTKLKVKNPDQKIPNPGGKGVDQTNGETVKGYLEQLCPDAPISVAGGTGEVRVTPDFCQPNADPAANTASNSQTPVSCNCICDMTLFAQNAWTIQIDDNAFPNTDVLGSGNQRLDNIKKSNDPNSGGVAGVITVPSPNDDDAFGVATESGKLEDMPSFLILGHELCGHAKNIDRGTHSDDFNEFRGRGGHQQTVGIENQIRDEHGFERRGSFRHPFCGESFGHKKGTAPQQSDLGRQAECKSWRDEYNQLNGTNFGVQDVVPIVPGEKLPNFSVTTHSGDPNDNVLKAQIGFRKDRPQPWFNPAAALNASLTGDGKTSFATVLQTLEFHPARQIQLEGHASIEKPAAKPNYNDPLSQQRAELIRDELLKKKIDPSRFANSANHPPAGSCVPISAGVFACSDSQASSTVDPKDRKVEVVIF